MYEMCDEWVNSLKGTFMGGSRPNLSDLVNCILYNVM